jgi:SMI1 / KNR4 family (SUKH-1)
MDVTTIPGIITLYPPASPESIDRLRAELGLELPDEYVALLAQADGVYADSFTLYPSEDVPERMRTYEVAVCAPGFLAIGDDGGGQAIVLRAGRGPSPVFVVGHGVMTPDHMVTVAACLSDWVRLGCPLDNDPD